MKLFILLYLLITSSLAFGDTSKCLDQNEWLEIKNDFAFKSKILEGIDLCNEDDVSYRVVRALINLKKLQKESPENRVLGEGAYSYFKNRIKEIYFFGEYCSDYLAAYVLGNEPVMYVCPGFKSSALIEANILVHEARHVDGYPHVHCSKGNYYKKDLDSTGACDKDFESQGSYGIGTSFLLGVYNTTKDPIKKQAARSGIITNVVHHFNEMPLELRQGLVVQSHSGDVSFFDGKKKELMFKENASSTMYIDDYYRILFSREDASILVYFYAPDLVDTGTRWKEKIKDAYFDEKYACLLRTARLICFYYEGKTYTLDLTIEPSRLFKSGRYLYMTDEEGRLYELPTSPEKLELTELVVPSFGALKIVDIEKARVMLDLKGVLHEAADDSRTPIPQYKNEKILNIAGPYYWSKKLHDL